MASTGTISVPCGDAPDSRSDNEDKNQNKVSENNGHGPKRVEIDSDSTPSSEQDPVVQIEDELGSLKISSPADQWKTSTDGPNEKPKRGSIPEELVIRPIEIDQNNSLRTSVVLVAGNGREIRPKLGAYSIEGKFLRPAKINKWVMVFLFDKQAVADIAKGTYTFDDIKGFAERYVQVGLFKGVKVAPLASIQCIPPQASPERNVETMTADDLKQALRQLYIKLNNHLIHHAIVILPDKCPAWLHPYLQYLETSEWNASKDPEADRLMRTSRMRLVTLIELGLKSRCYGKQALIPQIWLKYNTKLGGINVSLKRTFDTHEMKFLDGDHLILSLDLCYRDEPTKAPLVAAAVGMWDLASPQMSFYTETRVQPGSAEISSDSVAIRDLATMTRQILLAYKKTKDSQLPSRIIIFRAGGYRKADDELALKELIEVKRALMEEQSGDQPIRPLLTYLKVPKRSKIRKWQESATRSSGDGARGRACVSSGGRPRDSTVRKGSLVDYIESAQAPELAPTPTPEPAPAASASATEEPKTRGAESDRKSRSHVFKLYDEANLSSTAVQSMIYMLSYLSPRVTARTRPTPIDLADLASERTHNIVAVWAEENKIPLSGDGDSEFLVKANDYLANLGDRDYKKHLYYA